MDNKITIESMEKFFAADYAAWTEEVDAGFSAEYITLDDGTEIKLVR